MSTGVKTVLVAGEPILKEGRFTRIDKDEVLNELAASLRVPLRPDEEQRRGLARRVFPHVKRFYDGYWGEAVHDPFYRPSSTR